MREQVVTFRGLDTEQSKVARDPSLLTVDQNLQHDQLGVLRVRGGCTKASGQTALGLPVRAVAGFDPGSAASSGPERTAAASGGPEHTTAAGGPCGTAASGGPERTTAACGSERTTTAARGPERTTGTRAGTGAGARSGRQRSGRFQLPAAGRLGSC